MSRVDKAGLEPPPLGTRGRGLLSAHLLLAIALVAVFVDLGARSLHVADTARWGQLAREMIRSGHWLVPTRYGEIYANKPVLYLWAVAAPAALWGEVTPFLVRLPSALGLLLMIFTTAWWAGFRTGARGVGRTAGLLLLSTFAVAWQGREGRLDMMGSGLSVAATALLLAAPLLMTTQATLRSRIHPGAKERFNQRLAVFLKGRVPVLIVPPLTPENVFHGAPDASYPYTAGSPWSPSLGSQVLVLCRPGQVPAVLKADPENGQVLLPAEADTGRVIVGFGFP